MLVMVPCLITEFSGSVKLMENVDKIISIVNYMNMLKIIH